MIIVMIPVSDANQYGLRSAALSDRIIYGYAPSVEEMPCLGMSNPLSILPVHQRDSQYTHVHTCDSATQVGVCHMRR